jgi:DHA3 family macrolide efflux protein-like MFS transporter
MLVSGVAAGIAAGIAFGGDWRRLSILTLRYWPLLALAAALRIVGVVFPASPLGVYLLALVCVAVVAALNWRLPGALLIAVGTLMNVFVIVLNSGMPYDPAIATSNAISIPTDGLHVRIQASTLLPFLGDIVPVSLADSIYSIGDFLIAFGGFFIPFSWLQAPSEAVVARQELRSTNFSLFWLAQVVSRFGDPITLIALTFVTYRTTRSALLTALAVVIATIPNALFSLFGGAIADALGARRAMLACDILRALLVGAVPLLIGLNAPLAIVFLFVFLAGACGAIFNPARAAIVPSLLTPDRLAAGNALVYASDRAVEIGGALAGGVLVATLSEGAFYADAITFAFSALLLARVVVSEVPKPLTLANVLRDALDGLRFVRRTAVVWANTVFSLTAQLALPLVNGLTPVFLVRRFAGNDPSAGAVQFGASEAAIALGAVLASALLPRYISRIPKGRLLIGGFLEWGVMVVLLALAPSFGVALACFALMGVGNVLFFVPNMTIVQEATPPAVRARVFGARIALTNLSWLPIVIVSGALADVLPVEALVGAAGLVTVVAASVAAFVPAIRDVP